MPDPAVTAASVAAHRDAVLARIAATGRDPATVTVVAVTKGFGPEAMVAAVEAGLVDVGENYAQECAGKIGPVLDRLAADGVTARPRLHFIGRLQSNKVRLVAPHVALWQSVDRASLGVEIARRVPGAAVLVQVNVSDEPAKGGCAPGEVDGLVARLRDLGLDVQGLMAVGRTGTPDDARPGFAWLRSACDRLRLPTCSMGMTDDLEIAVAEGSTMVRVGSALFGMRPSPPPSN
jgi:pyridoxal phosphate enzyme (YggS family)